METKLVRCDERPYREPAKPTGQDTLFGRLATDKALSGRNGNKNDGWPEQPPACLAASQSALL
eukprot:364189-Chlamydomonas_euryale.AAC.41